MAKKPKHPRKPAKRKPPAKHPAIKHRRDKHPGALNPGETILEARLRKEIAFADAMQLALEQRRSELISRDQAIAYVRESNAIAAEILYKMADETAPVLAATTDPVRCGQILHDASLAAVEEIERKWKALAENAGLPAIPTLEPSAKTPKKRGKS